MRYRLLSGKYETGSYEEQQEYITLLGEDNIQEKFDLYFHWYNIIHELGHILIAENKLTVNPVYEEMLVNEFAVAYWTKISSNNNLLKFKEVINSALDRMTSPIPTNTNFLTYFKENWNTLKMTSSLYRFFQLRCIKEVLDNPRDLSIVLMSMGYINLDLLKLNKYDYVPNAEISIIILKDFISNFKNLGIHLPEIELNLVTNPNIQRIEKSN